MDKSKLQAVIDWVQSTNVKQLRGFIGLTGYYRRFVKGYAHLAAPFTDLLQKDAFHWTPSATVAFYALKRALTTAPVLALPDFSIPFVLETDASGSGIKAVLSQNNHPIAYFSKKLSPRMQRQSTYVREFYAIIEALAKFCHYLLGHKFVIKTDQKGLKELLEQQLQTPEQQQWLPKFIGFDFTIQFKSGRDNIVADALSRSFMLAWSAPQNQWLKRVVELVQVDPKLKPLYDQFVAHQNHFGDYTVKDGLLFWKARILLPYNEDPIQ